MKISGGVYRKSYWAGKKLATPKFGEDDCFDPIPAQELPYGEDAESQKGERSLLKALVDDALRCVRGTAVIFPKASKYRENARRYERLGALEWFCYEGREAWSFNWVCEHLNISQDNVIEMVGRILDGIRSS